MGIRVNAKKSLIAIFSCIVICPLCLQGINHLTGRRLDFGLKGYFEKQEKPSLTLEDFISGSFQDQYDEWLNANLLPRGAMVKLYNQIQYSLFSQGNRIIGRHGNIFETNYVNDVMTIGDYNFCNNQNQAMLENYVHSLERIQERLEGMGKYFLVYTTPSKAVYRPEDIPIQYFAQNERGVRAIDYFHQLLNDSDIHYLDTSDIATKDYPLFYSTGIHWARPYEQQASHAVLERLSALSGKGIRSFELQDMTESDQPFWRDTDVYDLLNVIAPPNEQTYYEYKTARAYPEHYDKVRMLLQGGSFSEGIQRDFFERYNNEELYYINYDYYIQGSDKAAMPLTQWADLDLGFYLDRVDFVVIELNEAIINQYSSGFVAYLDSYLDTYVPHSVGFPDMGANLNVTEKTGLEQSCGFYGYENGEYVWAKESASVTLQSKAITSEGILVEIGIHEEVLKDGDVTLTVYINQTKKYEVTLKQAGVFSFVLLPENLDDSQDDIYEVELLCDKFFNPKERGMSEDDRDLALMVYYIGENR